MAAGARAEPEGESPTTSRDVAAPAPPGSAEGRAPDGGPGSEIPWRALVETSLDPFALLGSDATVHYVSESIKDLLGYDVGAYRGRNVFDFLHPDDVADARAALVWALAHAGQRVVISARGRHKNGAWIDLEAVAVSRLADPQVRAVLVSLRDVSERKQSEAALRAGNARQRLLEKALEAAANAVMIADKDGRITWVNPAFTALTGYSQEEVVGRSPRILRSGEHDAAFYAALWETVLSGRVWRGEIVNRRKDGSTYAEEMTITPFVDPRGAVTQFVAIKQDVSERKALEEQLRQAQKMEAVGRLAGGVAHDFNNLLTAILGYGGMLLASAGEEDPRRRKVEQIVRAAERGASLTHQLLAFSRKQVLQPQVLDLNHVIADVETMLRRMIGEDVELKTDLAMGLGCVRADAGQVVQVLMNLAINARDAMPGGGRLVIQTSGSEGAARSGPGVGAAAGRWITISVADTGTGMDAGVKSHLFEPFFTTKEAGKGTGLGLATVYGIVEQSGGHVEVESEPGKGACFRIAFPCVDASEDCREAKVAPHGPARGTETILVIEDEDAVRHMVRESLEEQGYTVLEASSGAQALDAVSRHRGPLHLMVSDIVMPGMNGPELAAKVRAVRPGVGVLFISGYADEALVGHDVIGPGSELLSKPFLPSVLARRIRELLDRPAGGG